jgi:hypothetical protein
MKQDSEVLAHVALASGWVRENIACAFCGVGSVFFANHIRPQVKRRKISGNLVKYSVADLRRYVNGEMPQKLTASERKFLLKVQAENEQNMWGNGQT